MGLERGQEHLAHERGLTGAAYASNADETAQRNFDAQVFEIVDGGALQKQCKTGFQSGGAEG